MRRAAVKTLLLGLVCSTPSVFLAQCCNPFRASPFFSPSRVPAATSCAHLEIGASQPG